MSLIRKDIQLYSSWEIVLNDVCSRDDDGSLVLIAMLISEFDHIFSPRTLLASYLLTIHGQECWQI